ncbi:MAG: hypothetical protein Q8P32_03715 [Candidatus Komeilibacteria bacterium]|nr:hypothetical protein [Candidatus Komeilibacteria bacterium]
MYEIYLAVHFLRQLKSLLKKYPGLTDDLIKQLKDFNKDLVTPLGHKLYKLRLKSSDLPRGKSKSFRVIVFLWEFRNTLIPITIYFKGNTENINQKDLEYHLAVILQEIENE